MSLTSFFPISSKKTGECLELFASKMLKVELTTITILVQLKWELLKKIWKLKYRNIYYLQPRRLKQPDNWSEWILHHLFSFNTRTMNHQKRLKTQILWCSEQIKKQKIETYQMSLIKAQIITQIPTTFNPQKFSNNAVC